MRHGLKHVQGVEVMGPRNWKRLVDAASRRYKALMVVLRDPAAAKQKAEAAEAARCCCDIPVCCVARLASDARALPALPAIWSQNHCIAATHKAFWFRQNICTPHSIPGVD